MDDAALKALMTNQTAYSLPVLYPEEPFWDSYDPPLGYSLLDVSNDARQGFQAQYH
jgi:hypothetical protein